MTVKAARRGTLRRALLATMAALCANAPLPSQASAAEPDAASDEQAAREALVACEQRRGDRRIEGACRLYAVNEEIVAVEPAD